MAFPLSLTLAPAALSLKPGGSAEISVTINNISDLVQHYQVTIVGLPSDDLWSREQDITKLRPGESGAVRVRISLPDKGGLVGGQYVLGVLVTSPYQPDVSRSADLTLTVEAVSGITMAAQPAIAYGHDQAAFTVSLKNEGNVGVNVELTAIDDQGRARFVLQPPTLALAPGVAQPAMVEVRAPGPFTGQERRSAITIRGQVAGETRGEAQVTFIQTPRVPAALFRTLGIVLAVAVVAAAIVVGGLLGRSATPPNGAAATPPAGASPSMSTSAAAGADPPTVTPLTIDPTPPVAQQKVTFRTEASQDVTTWKWEVFDPTNAPLAAGTKAKSFSFTFPTAGAFTLRLTVANAAGSTVTLTQKVTVGEPPPNYQPVLKSIELAPGESATNSALCPAGKVVLGGGIDTEADDVATAGSVIETSYPTGDNKSTQWTGGVRNDGPLPSKINVVAACANRPVGYSVKSKDKDVLPMSTDSLTVQCGSGRVILGGGGGIRSDDVTDTQSFVEESVPAKGDNDKFSAWRVTVRNNASTTQQLTVRAICGEKPDNYAVVPVPFSAAAGEVPFADVATCPADTVAMSGGAGVDEESSPRDPGTETVLRESTPALVQGATAPPTQWAAALKFTGTIDQVLAVHAVCGKLSP